MSTLDPVDTEFVRKGLDALPRIDLGVGVTPLEHLPRLSAELDGPQIYIKRDDLAGGPLGGNKTRMLEFVLAKAVAGGATAVVGGSAVQSNYSRQLAASCARLGLRCYLVLREIRPEDAQIQGSLLLDYLYGARIEVIGDDRGWQTDRLNQLAEELEAAGDVVYRAPQASDVDKPLHAVAYVDAFFELCDQMAAMSIDPSHLYVSSLDTTHAGLLLGLRASGSSIELRAISPNEPAIFPDHTIADEVARIASEAAVLLGADIAIDAGSVETDTSMVGERYGFVTAGCLHAMRCFARSEAIILDPVYSSKAAAALIADIEHGILGKEHSVVFWHTGGIPAVFAYASEIARDFVDG